MNKQRETEIAACLRRGLLAPGDVSDEDLLRVCEGSLLRARIELRLALEEFCSQVVKALHIRDVLQWLSRWIVGNKKNQS